MDIRGEFQTDAGAIHEVVTAAFLNAAHRSGAEAAIVEALRKAGELTISLVAVVNEEILGHVAFSPVKINDAAGGWFGLGPVAVRPDNQLKGIGHRLITEGLTLLRESGANGCVVLGDPAYYARFGFQSDPSLIYQNVPPEDFQRLSFDETRPTGAVTYHESFPTI